MSATDLLETALGNALFLGEPPLTITQWTIHLASSGPDETGQLTEINSAYGYQPVRYDPGPDRWIKAANPDGEGRTVYRNTQTITFPVATGNWWGVGTVGLKDQNGQLLFVALLNTNKNVAIGQQALFLPGELEIAIG